MGIILNPIAYRVGYRLSWVDAWYLRGWVHSVFLHDVFFIKCLIHFLFFRFFRYRRNNWIFSHMNVYVYNNKINLNIYLYDASSFNHIYDRMTKRHKWVHWYRMFFVSYFFKKNLFDGRKKLSRFHMFAQTMRFFYDCLTFEDLRVILGIHDNDRKLAKHLEVKELQENFLKKNWTGFNWFFRVKKWVRFIDKKRKKNGKDVFLLKMKPIFKILLFVYHDDNYKYWDRRIKREVYNKYKHKSKKLFYEKMRKENMNSESSNIWFAWETIRPFQKSWRSLRSTLNGVSLRWWITRYSFLYKSFIEKAFYKKFFINDKNFVYYMKNRNFFKVFNFVNSNYRIFFNFIILMRRIFRKISKGKMNNRIMLRRINRRGWRTFLRFYIFFFVKKKILFFYKRFFDLILGFINYNANISFFLIDNSSVTASFISRFLAIGLRSRYNYSDMIFPIKNSLTRLLYVRKWALLKKTRILNSYSDQDFILYTDFLRISGVLEKKIFHVRAFIVDVILNNVKDVALDNIKFFFNSFFFFKFYLNVGFCIDFKYLLIFKREFKFKYLNNTIKCFDVKLSKNFIDYSIFNLFCLYTNVDVKYCFFRLNKFIWNFNVRLSLNKKINYRFFFLKLKYYLNSGSVDFFVLDKFVIKIFSYLVRLIFYKFFYFFFLYISFFFKGKGRILRFLNFFVKLNFFFLFSFIRNNFRIKRKFFILKNRKFLFFFMLGRFFNLSRDLNYLRQDYYLKFLSRFEFFNLDFFNLGYFIGNKSLDRLFVKYRNMLLKYKLKMPFVLFDFNFKLIYIKIRKLLLDKSFRNIFGFDGIKNKKSICEYMVMKDLSYSFDKKLKDFVCVKFYFIMLFLKFLLRQFVLKQGINKLCNLFCVKFDYDWLKLFNSFILFFSYSYRFRFFYKFKTLLKIRKRNDDLFNFEILKLNRFLIKLCIEEDNYVVDKKFNISFEKQKQWFINKYKFKKEKEKEKEKEKDRYNFRKYMSKSGNYKYSLKKGDSKKGDSKYDLKNLKKDLYKLERDKNILHKNFRVFFKERDIKLGRVKKFFFIKNLFIKSLRKKINGGFFFRNRRKWLKSKFFSFKYRYIKYLLKERFFFKQLFYFRFKCLRFKPKFYYLYFFNILNIDFYYVIFFKYLFFNVIILNINFFYIKNFYCYVTYYLSALNCFNFYYIQKKYRYQRFEIGYFYKEFVNLFYKKIVNFYSFFNIVIYDNIFLKNFVVNIVNYKDYLKYWFFVKNSNILLKRPLEKRLALFFYNKDKRMKYVDNNLSVLYGYKFHFVGRFTRKQRSANLWFIKGAIPYSNMLAKIDYSVMNVILKYSICSIKVWLYKSKIAPNYRMRIF